MIKVNRGILIVLAILVVLGGSVLSRALLDLYVHPHTDQTYSILKEKPVADVAENMPRGGNPQDRQTDQAYSIWKEKHIAAVAENMFRVVNPQDSNITVSEGMGYGLLFSAAVGDEATFVGLWNYVKHYRNENGLMHWKIDEFGNVSGQGSATDADQDIAYALLMADEKWAGNGYREDATQMIEAIGRYEVAVNYRLLPGDKWDKGAPFNPSYFSPAYYEKFKEVSGDPKWDRVLAVNMQFVTVIANPDTGFLPDWADQNGTVTQAVFGYDALRVPIRLLHYNLYTKNEIAADILEKEYNTIAGIGAESLRAGYTLSGQPLTNYLDTPYLSSFAAVSFVHPYSKLSIGLMKRLINTVPDDYYGGSLKVWILLIIDGRLH